MNTENGCFLTGASATIERLSPALWLVTSKPCGAYLVTQRAAKREFWDQYENQLYILAAIARQRSDIGERLELGPGIIDDVLVSVAVPETPMKKLDTLLQYVAKESGRPGKTVKLENEKDYTIAFAHDKAEFNWLLDTANKLGYFKDVRGALYGSGANVELALKGWQHVDELNRIQRDSDQAFVAMSFADEMDAAWREGIEPALKKTGWTPLYLKESKRNEKIDDQIIAGIRQSSLVIADVTEHKQNVYFEAGFAMGLGIDVIWTCKKKDWTPKKVQFDTQRFPHIIYESPEDLREQLATWIIANNLSRR